MARKETGMTYSEMLAKHHNNPTAMNDALERGDLRKELIAPGVCAYFYPQVKRASSP